MDSYIDNHGTFHAARVTLKFVCHDHSTCGAELSDDCRSIKVEGNSQSCRRRLWKWLPIYAYLHVQACMFQISGIQCHLMLMIKMPIPIGIVFVVVVTRLILFFWLPESTVQKRTVNVRAIPLCSTIYASNQCVLLYGTCGSQPVPVLDFYGYTCDR